MEGSREEDVQILEAYSRSVAAGEDESLRPRGVLKALQGGSSSGSLAEGIYQRTARRHADAPRYGGSTVCFTEDTHPGIEADLALSITRHRIKDGRYVEYTIVVHQKGQDSIHPIQKRYKQFEALQKHMKKENKDYELPHLPGKRWFKANKWDDNYHIDRRFALQLYLRLMVKLYGKSSLTLRKFLELREERGPKNDDMPTRESERLMLEKMNSMNALNNVSNYAQKLDADAAAVLQGVSLPPPPSSILQGSSGDAEDEGKSLDATLLPAPGQRGSTNSVQTITDSGITGDPWDEMTEREKEAISTEFGSPPLGERERERTNSVDSGSKETRDGRTSSLTNFSDSDSDGESEINTDRGRTGSSPIAIKSGVGEAEVSMAETDYLMDSITSSFQLREKRMSSSHGLGDDEDNENILAANLNLHLLNSAKQAESPFYGKAEMEHASERAHSSELFPGQGISGADHSTPSSSSAMPLKAEAEAEAEAAAVAAAVGQGVFREEEEDDSEGGISDGEWNDDQMVSVG